MHQIKILIVEDELIFAESMASKLRKMGYHITGIALEVKQALELMDQKPPDLVLIDINLSGYEYNEDHRNGIHLAEIINERYQIPFIFLTGMGNDSIIQKAKHTHPQAYLTKPVKHSELYANIEVAFAKSSEYLVVQDGELPKKIRVKDIEWIEADGNMKNISLASEQECLAIRHSMDKLQAMLSSHYFIRCHRSFIVNIELIQEIKGDDIYVNGKKIPIGRSYKEDTYQRLGIK